VILRTVRLLLYEQVQFLVESDASRYGVRSGRIGRMRRRDQPKLLQKNFSFGNLEIGGKNANLRARTGASVVAILREGHMMANPKSMTVFQPGDRIGLIGEREEIDAVEQLLTVSIVSDFSKGTEKQD